MNTRALSLSTLLLLAACGSAPSTTSTDVPGLNGTVLAPDGRPAVGASVTIFSADPTDLTPARVTRPLRAQATPTFQTTTDAAGRYHSPAVATGTYTVIAQSGSLSGALLGVPVTAGETVKAPPVQLAEPGTVTGTVALDGAGDAAGVELMLAGTPYTAHSDHAGQYTLPAVPAGTYRLVAQAPGCARASVSVTVSAGRTVSAAALTVARLPAPTVSGLSPFYASPGKLLTVRGANFGTTRGTGVVSVGGVAAAEYVAWSDTAVTVRVAAGTPLFAQTVVVTTGGGQSVTTDVDIVRTVTPVDAGGRHTLAVTSGGSVVAWGSPAYGVTIVPTGLSGVIAVAGGNAYSVALRGDGTVAAWGSNSYGQTSIPAGLSGVIGVAAGSANSLAVRSDGTAVAWGRNDSGQSTVPGGLTGVVAVAAGFFHSLALTSDGTVVAWGKNDMGQSTVPAGLTDVVAIAAGGLHSLALRRDGTVVAWGDNAAGQGTIPAGLTDVIAVAGGSAHSLALKRDGTVVAWGDNTYGQSTVPAGLTGVVAVTAGLYYSVALKSDGTVVAWGDNTDGQTSVPAGLSTLVP